MKRILVIWLALCVLTLAGCGQKQSIAPSGDPQQPVQQQETPSDDPQQPTQQGADSFTGLAEVTCGSLVLPVPYEYAERLIVNCALEPWKEHWTPLVSLAERASVEAGQLDHPDEDWGDGELCTLLLLDRVGFEDWASGEQTGTRLFARDGDDAYYLIAQPTDVRLYRGEGADYDEDTVRSWAELSDWVDALPDELVARNGLTAYDAQELFGAEYTYGGEHAEYSYQTLGEAMDRIILSLSQPARQGEGGVWGVERVHFVYSDYSWTDTQLVFPAALGIDQTAAEYYAQLQTECDAGEHPELLTPLGAALDYARRVAWLFGEDVSATDFVKVEALG